MRILFVFIAMFGLVVFPIPAKASSNSHYNSTIAIKISEDMSLKTNTTNFNIDSSNTRTDNLSLLIFSPLTCLFIFFHRHSIVMNTDDLKKDINNLPSKTKSTKH